MDPDLPLIEAIQAGDDSALNELIHRHREPLFHFALRFLHNETAARDVVQETFVRAYFKAPKFEPRASVKTWLHVIALNLARDHLRRLVKRRGGFPLDASALDAPFPPELADSRPTPDQEAGVNDLFRLLQRAIDGLPHSLREALILFSLEGKSQQEAAAILNTTPKTIETRVYRAKARLRSALGSEMRFDET